MRYHSILVRERKILQDMVDLLLEDIARYGRQIDWLNAEMQRLESECPSILTQSDCDGIQADKSETDSGTVESSKPDTQIETRSRAVTKSD